MNDWKTQRLRQFATFSLGGTAIFIVEMIITIFLTEILHLWHMTSYTIALLISLIGYFTFNSLITFRNTTQPRTRFLRFTATFLVSIITGWMIVFLLTASGLHYIIAIISVAATLSVVNYLINLKWVFR